MNTTHLVTMLTLMQEKSYQRTAAALHYSRSTAMEHVKALEQELGVPLFQKDGQKLVPTEAGVHFAEHAKEILAHYHQALQEAQHPACTNALRVLAVETLGLYFLRAPITEIMLRHPNTELSVKFGAHSAFCNMLRAGEADIAFGFAGQSWGCISSAEFTVIPICQEPIVFFAGANSVFARKAAFTVDDLCSVPVWMANRDGVYNEFLQTICRNSRSRIQVKKYVDSGTLLKQFVAETNCVSILCRSVIQEELENGTLKELPWVGSEMHANVIAVVKKHASNEICDDLIASLQRAKATRAP